MQRCGGGEDTSAGADIFIEPSADASSATLLYREMQSVFYTAAPKVGVAGLEQRRGVALNELAQHPFFPKESRSTLVDDFLRL